MKTLEEYKELIDKGDESEELGSVIIVDCYFPFNEESFGGNLYKYAKDHGYSTMVLERDSFGPVTAGCYHNNKEISMI